MAKDRCRQLFRDIRELLQAVDIECGVAWVMDGEPVHFVYEALNFLVLIGLLCLPLLEVDDVCDVFGLVDFFDLLIGALVLVGSTWQVLSGGLLVAVALFLLVKAMLRGAVKLSVREVSSCNLVDVLHLVRACHVMVWPLGKESLHEDFLVLGVESLEEQDVALSVRQLL